MPDFTQPHGISYPLPGDLIKDGNALAKLSNDIRATAQTVDIALTAEGSRSTSKANLAKLEAVSTASRDATSKSNSARAVAIAESKAYTDQVLDTSHLARDVDGTPYFSPGSMTLRVFSDTDGVPFFLDA